MGTEIHTFTTLKDMTEYLTDQSDQYKALFEDYSQWLGTLLPVILKQRFLLV